MTVSVKGEVLGLREFTLPPKKNGNGSEGEAFRLTLVRLFCRSVGEIVEYQPLKGSVLPVSGKEIEVKIRLRAYVSKGGLAAIGAEQVA